MVASWARTQVVEALRGGLVVSCQAYPDEPMLDASTMVRIARAAVAGGAVAVRLKGLDDLALGVPVLPVPVIGLVKVGTSGVFITPTLDDCLAVAATGAAVVALDGTRRPRPDGRTLAATIAALKQAHPDVTVMADCGSADDARAAQDAGADLLGTTLAGYSGEQPPTPGPDWQVLDEVVALAEVPVIAEGRIHTPDQAGEALHRGAHAVCVGTAITHPTTITSWFVDALDARGGSVG
ncbi:N-acetylmannosamine-6-phosphate 2-epimerase [Aestuariimicrobium ganziense]|uniref:N-acetylmannosamine-6-phosphate 2-epimerase n=1 Tax=Aestuariimicrobium ganziense TaxID=2773677 RepID=UPI0019403BA1|nr:putative N-acetylmannosamine-6-phosphate 2-epimerase [Aestuariimicrobium ganziense]